MKYNALLIACLLVAPAWAQPDHRHPPHRQAHDAEPLPEPRVEIVVRDSYRYVLSNGLPDHTTGQFPKRGNPHTITAQDYRYRMPAAPEARESPLALAFMPFGVAINGVPFDPGAAEFWDPDSTRRARRPVTDGIWQYEALSGHINLGLDHHHAHVQPSGAYHYHGLPTGLIENLRQQQTQPGMIHVGFAADGYPIYASFGYADPNDPETELITLRPSYQLKQGHRPAGQQGPGGRYDGTFVQDYEFVPGSGDLDECNGRFGITHEFPQGTYYYVLTDTFPFIPRAFRATPDSSFMRRRAPR